MKAKCGAAIHMEVMDQATGQSVGQDQLSELHVEVITPNQPAWKLLLLASFIVLHFCLWTLYLWTLCTSCHYEHLSVSVAGFALLDICLVLQIAPFLSYIIICMSFGPNLNIKSLHASTMARHLA